MSLDNYAALCKYSMQRARTISKHVCTCVHVSLYTYPMLREKAIALLKIHTQELRMVTLVAALFLCIQAGQGIGENAAFGLFLSRQSVDRLPYMYIGLGGLVSLASLVYATSLSRFRHASVVTVLLVASAVLFVSQWLAIEILGLSIYPVLWLTTYGMSVILGTLLWTIAGSVCDARQAKRLFSLFTSMGILGSVLGNLLTGVFAEIAGTANLILFYAALLLAGFFLTREITRSYFKPETHATESSLIRDMRAGFDFVRQSQLFRLIAISAILYSVLFFTVDFPFSQILSTRFSENAASLAGFKGLFTSIATAVTFLVSLFLANRLYTKLGIIGSILIMPITYVVAFIVFFASFTFTGAVIVRFSQLVMLGGLMGTAWNALFNVVPPERRGQVLAFNNGVPAQLGVLLSGVMIILSRKILSTQDVLLLGAVLACVTVYLTFKMKSAYGEALLSALRSGRVEVFSDQEEAFSGYQNDPGALEVVHQALHDPNPDIRRLAVEMTAKMQNQALLPHLVERLFDEDGEVRATATHAVAEMGGASALSDVILGLDDPEDHVREETLASLPKLGVAGSPELIRTLERLLRDNNPAIQAHAAIVLMYLFQSESAEQIFAKLLKDKDAQTRRIALQSFGHIAEGIKERINIKVELIADAFEDESPAVRREAARIAHHIQANSISQPLTNLLRDKDAGVRRIASASLKQLWPQSRAVLTEMLSERDGVALYAVLDSIPSAQPDILLPLRKYIQSEVSNIHYLQSFLDSLPRQGHAVSLLIDTLINRKAKNEERLIKAVGLFGNPRALDLIRKTLNAGDASTRAAALEALETLGDHKITLEVLPILDRGGVFERDDNRLELIDALEMLLDREDHWIRALATRSLVELGVADQVGQLNKLMNDKDPLVQQAARDAMSQMDGTSMKTLKTLSTMDRILLLRQIPIFSKLTPEDLEKIAEIAHEELYSSGGIICREGEVGSSLYLIVNGEVEVVKSSGKEEKILAVRKTGEFVGEMAILDSASRSATLRALNEVRVLSIDGGAFNMILLDRPEVAVSVLRNMSSRIRELNEKVGANG